MSGVTYNLIQYYVIDYGKRQHEEPPNSLASGRPAKWRVTQSDHPKRRAGGKGGNYSVSVTVT